MNKVDIYHTRNLSKMIDELILSNVKKEKFKRNLLGELRKAKNISQLQAAESINIQRAATYSEKESGINEFTLSEAHALSRLLEINLEEFYLALMTYREEKGELNGSK